MSSLWDAFKPRHFASNVKNKVDNLSTMSKVKQIEFIYDPKRFSSNVKSKVKKVALFSHLNKNLSISRWRVIASTYRSQIWTWLHHLHQRIWLLTSELRGNALLIWLRCPNSSGQRLFQKWRQNAGGKFWTSLGTHPTTSFRSDFWPHWTILRSNDVTTK